MKKQVFAVAGLFGVGVFGLGLLMIEIAALAVVVGLFVSEFWLKKDRDQYLFFSALLSGVMSAAVGVLMAIKGPSMIGVAAFMGGFLPAIVSTWTTRSTQRKPPIATMACGGGDQ